MGRETEDENGTTGTDEAERNITLVLNDDWGKTNNQLRHVAETRPRRYTFCYVLPSCLARKHEGKAALDHGHAQTNKQTNQKIRIAIQVV